MATARQTSRRSLLAGLGYLAGSSMLAGPAAAAVSTPRAAEGPYYPQPGMRRPDIDNDLVKIKGRVTEADGEILIPRGRVMHGDGRPRAGHRVEIWQCDQAGNYMHPRDSGSADFDPAFQGFGHNITDDAGAYVFRTIKPAVYPGRAPHIHVKVLDGARELLTTQFYTKDDPGNANDWLFNQLSASQVEAVSMTFTDGATGPEATVNIVI